MQNIKLFVFDIDNTITTGPSIWEMLHLANGTWETAGKKYLEQYNAGQFDFDEFARKDALAWQNMPLATLEKVMREVQVALGFPELMALLHKKKISTAIVSCSVGQFAQYLQNKFKIDHIQANPLEIKNGRLTGQIDIQVSGDRKVDKLLELLKKLNITKENIAVIGDSHFDLPMFEHSQHTFIIKNAKYQDQAKYFIQDFFEVVKLLQAD